MKIISLSGLPFSKVSHNPLIKKRVMIENGELDHITNFSQAVIPAGEIADAHSHEDMAEVFWVVSGEGEIFINGLGYELISEVCAMVEPGEVHEIRNSGNKELIINYFGIQTIQ